MPSDTTTPAGTPRDESTADVPTTDSVPRPRAGGYRAVFAVREFRAVFAAHLLSLLGVVVSELALTVLVYDLTGSPLLSALTFALGFLPYIVGGTLFMRRRRPLPGPAGPRHL